MSEHVTERQNEEQPQGSGPDASTEEKEARASGEPSGHKATEDEHSFCRDDAKDDSGRQYMPKPTFSTFVMSLASSALVHLGEVPEPASGQMREDLVLAKHSIDILCMLQDKIASGLDADETRLLNGLLYELRMKYVVKK